MLEPLTDAATKLQQSSVRPSVLCRLLSSGESRINPAAGIYSTGVQSVMIQPGNSLRGYLGTNIILNALDYVLAAHTRPSLGVHS